jgi:iron complex outermembrane recepter protein
MALRQRLCLTMAACATCATSTTAVAEPEPPTSRVITTETRKLEPSEIAVGEDEPEAIIVTARRREEEIQRTPVSVVSLNARELESRSLSNLRGLQNFVPNLTFAPSQNVGDAAGNIFIRGIGQEDFLAGSEPGVGFYLDGIYVGRTMGTLMDLIDVARIEVLRGPQGTLYGKNAIGGAINIISATPGPEMDANAGLITGNLGRLELRGAVNAPLSDTLIVRLSAGRFLRDGYLKRLRAPFAATAFTESDHRSEGSLDSAAGRLQLRWLASATLSIDFAADASRRRGTQSATHVDAIDPTSGILPDINQLIRDGLLPAPEITETLVSSDSLTSHAGGTNSISQNIEGVAATVTKDMGAHSLRFIGAHRRLRSHVSTDLDGSWFTILGSDFHERHRQFSAELQASGSLDRLTYTAGLFGLHERTDTSSGRGVGRLDVLYLCGCFYRPDHLPRLFSSKRDLRGGSYATYAQGDFRLTKQLSATLGGRFSNEWKRMDVELPQLAPDTLEPTGVILNNGENRGRWNSFTWHAGLEFEATPDLMLYASAAKGYKSGGFNGRPVVNLPNLGLNEYDPETALTYEVGARSEWAGGRLRLNATIFHTSYHDIQLRQQIFAGGILTTLIDNAARARIRGVEIEGAAKLGKGLTANFAYGHLDPQYLDVGQVPNLTLQTAFSRTPRHSFTASLNYSTSFGRNRLMLHGDYSYRSREQFQLIASPFDQAGYGLLGARLALSDPTDRWSIAVFGTNLTDKRYRSAGRANGLEEVGFANSVVGLPSQVGVEFKAGL